MHIRALENKNKPTQSEQMKIAELGQRDEVVWRTWVLVLTDKCGETKVIYAHTVILLSVWKAGQGCG